MRCEGMVGRVDDDVASTRQQHYFLFFECASPRFSIRVSPFFEGDLRVFDCLDYFELLLSEAEDQTCVSGNEI